MNMVRNRANNSESLQSNFRTFDEVMNDGMSGDMGEEEKEGIARTPLKDAKSILYLLQDSIDLMASEEKEAYLHATIQCPDLVEEESDPLMFLHFEDYNIWRAAARLLKYWKWRKEIFQERAFLRILDLTGFGALDENTIKGIGTRAAYLLPNDDEGTYVFFFDRRNFGKEFYNQDQTRFLRMAFTGYQYILQEHRKKNTDEKAGYGLLNLLSSLPRWMTGNKSWANLIKEAMPFELRWVRMLVLSKENEDKTWFRAVLPYLQLVLQKKASFTRVEILSFDSQLEMKNKLLTMGFQEDGLPECLGGSFSINKKWGRSTKFAETAICEAGSLYLNGGNQKLDPRALSRKDVGHELSNHSEPLEVAIEAISFGDKVPLLKAKEYAADVYKAESHQQLFHLFHSHSTQAAANHLCQYWELRNKLFAERSFLWMNQAGTGSLRMVDMNVLRSGIIMILPKDRSGNFVLLYDHTKTIEHPISSLKRCLFYMLYLLMEQSSASINRNESIGGIQLLFRVNSQQNFPRTGARQRLDHILQAFPLRFTSFHLIMENHASTTPVDKKIIEQALSQMNTLFAPPKDQVIVHSSIPGENIHDSLIFYGFDKTNLPDYLGGDWTEETFFLWQDEVINYEASNKTSMTVRVEQKRLYFCRKEMEWKRICKEDYEKARQAPNKQTKRKIDDLSESRQSKELKQNVAVAPKKDSVQSPDLQATTGMAHMQQPSSPDGANSSQPGVNFDFFDSLFDIP